MDIYKTPDSKNQEPHNHQFKPVSAIAYGLLISIVLSTVVTIIEAIVFGIMIGLTQGTEAFSEDLFTKNSSFLLIDLILTFTCLYFAGRVTGKFAFGQELKFGLIVALITFFIYIAFYMLMDTGDQYPLWYDLGSFASVFVAVLLGANSIKQKHRQETPD